MARVLFYTGIGLLLLSAALLYLPIYFSIVLLCFILVFLLIIFCFSKHSWSKGIKTLLLICLSFLLVGIGTKILKVTPADELANVRATVVGRVQDWPQQYETYTVYQIRSESISVIKEDGSRKTEGIPQQLTLRLSDVNGLNFTVFDVVEMEVSFLEPDSYTVSNLADGIYAGGYIEKCIAIRENQPPFYACFYSLKKAISDILYRHLRYSDAAVVSAILLGERNGLTNRFEWDSRITGITHALVVSGMHLGIIFQLFGVLFGFFGLSKRLRALLKIGLLFALMAICGFTPSVLRAGLTYLIYALGEWFHRRPDALNSLGAATILILFTMPFGAGNISLLLSLSATFGLLYICPMVYELVLRFLVKWQWGNNRFCRGFVFALCQTLSATITTAPICVLCFGYFSLVAPLTNLLTGFAVTAILSGSILTVCLLCLPSVFQSAAALPMIFISVMARYLVWAVTTCADVDNAAVSVEPTALLPWGFLVLAIFAFGWYHYRHPKRKKPKGIAIVCVVLTCCCLVSSVVIGLSTTRHQLAVCSVGNGSLVVLHWNNNFVVIGAGDTENDTFSAQNYLLTRGSHRVDYLVLPSLKKSVAGGGPNLISQLQPREIVCSNDGDYALKMEHIRDQRFHLFETKTVLSLRPNVEIITLADVGTVINLPKESFVISVGNSAEDLLRLVAHKNPVFICDGDIPSDWKAADYRQIVISGNEQTVEFCKKKLPKMKVPILDTSQESITFRIS